MSKDLIDPEVLEFLRASKQRLTVRNDMSTSGHKITGLELKPIIPKVQRWIVEGPESAGIGGVVRVGDDMLRFVRRIPQTPSLVDLTALFHHDGTVSESIKRVLLACGIVAPE